MKSNNNKIKKEDLYRAFLVFQSFFLVILVFATLRPLQSSLVINKLGSAFFPYIWVMTAIFIGGVVLIFNRLADFFSRTTIFGISVVTSILVLGFMRWGLESPNAWTVKFSTALLAIWSDAFVVIMIEQFWAFANDFFTTTSARKIYGLMDTGSVLGGVIGSLSVGFLVKKVGSFNILYFCMGYLVLLVIPLILIRRLLKKNPELSFEKKKSSFKNEKGGALAGFKILGNNPYLRLIMIVVLLSQVISNLVEYHFNINVEQLRQSLDVQTGYLGNVHFYINTTSLVCNGLFVGLFLTLLGVRKTMLVSPVVNGFFSITQLVGAFFISPVLLLDLGLMMRITDKAFGYTFFRSSKEILYIPLSTEMKFRAKTVIDMFVYRFAKFVGSLLILPAMHFLGVPALQSIILFLVVVMIYFVFKVTRQKAL